MDYPFFLRVLRRVSVRGRRGITVRDVVDGDAVFLCERRAIAAWDVMGSGTVLGCVDAIDTTLGVATGDTMGLGDTTGGTVATGAIIASTCTTAMSGGLFRPLSVTTSNWKRC